MSSISNFPWGKFTLYATGAGTFGYILMKLTVPTEEQLYNRMAPDLRRKVDELRAARLAKEAEVNRQVTAQTASEVDPDKAKPLWLDQQNKKK